MTRYYVQIMVHVGDAPLLTQKITFDISQCGITHYHTLHNNGKDSTKLTKDTPILTLRVSYNVSFVRSLPKSDI